MRLILPILLCASVVLGAVLNTPLLAQGERSPKVSGVVELPPPQVVIQRLSGHETRGGGPGPNIRANQDTSGMPQNETWMAVNPLDMNNIVGGANDYRNGDATAGWYTSFDSGLTWTDGVFPIPGNYDASGDPAVAFGLGNRVYFAQLIFQRDNEIPPSGVYVSTSTDGGATWAAAVNVSTSLPDEFDDKELIACDTTTSAYSGNIYLSWTTFTDFYSRSPIYISRSTDGGSNFSTPLEISDTDSNQGSMPAVGRDGEVYLVWKDYYFDRILIDRSFDGGVTFGNDLEVASTTSVSYPLPGFAFRGNSFPYIAVDRTYEQYQGRLYCVWNDERNGDADIYLASSDDHGLTWTQPIRVNDDAVGNGRLQFFPFVTVTEGGAVDVMYYDNIYGSAGLIDVTLARSHDGGSSFGPSIRVTDQSFDPYDDGFGGLFIGDYNGMAATDNASYPFWTDTRSGTDADVYMSKVELAFQSSQDTVSASAPVPTTMTLDAGHARWGRMYLVLGTTSGTVPGTPYGPVTIPINIDNVTKIIYRNVNKPPLKGFEAQLDNRGRGTAVFSPSASQLAPFVGTTFHFAFITPSALGADYTSQALSLDVIP